MVGTWLPWAPRNSTFAGKGSKVGRPSRGCHRFPREPERGRSSVAAGTGPSLTPTVQVMGLPSSGLWSWLGGVPELNVGLRLQVPQIPKRSRNHSLLEGPNHPACVIGPPGTHGLKQPFTCSCSACDASGSGSGSPRVVARPPLPLPSGSPRASEGTGGPPGSGPFLAASHKGLAADGPGAGARPSFPRLQPGPALRGQLPSNGSNSGSPLGRVLPSSEPRGWSL